MPDITRRLKLPYIVPSQAQKEVTHNEALEVLDVLLHASAITIDDTPPEPAEKGDCYIVGPKPNGKWAAQANSLTYYTNGWNFIEAFEGLTVWVRDEGKRYTFNGAKWVTPRGDK
jgi:hypothetical protein